MIFNKIDHLISELCPNGVRWMWLEETCLSISAGGDLPENYLKGQKNPTDEFPYPIYSNGTDESALYGYTNSYKIDNEAVTISARGTIGYHAVRLPKFTPIVRLITLIPDNKQITTKFLNYVLDVTEIGHSGGSIPQLTVPNVKKIKIPIPPLPIQEEIVRILDTFTELEAKLEAELEARKKQYEWYRGELLTFGEEVAQRPLSDVAHFMNGKGHEKHIDENGKYIVVNSKFVSTEGRVKKYSIKQISPVSKNDILMVMSDLPNGKALAKCFYVDENDKYTLNQRICSLSVKDSEKLNAKFLFYLLNRNKQLLQYDSGADQTNLRKDDILEIKIPMPPLVEQNRIVFILDKFDALVNDISIGLPAELKARRQQYEYYRNKLLTFKVYES